MNNPEKSSTNLAEASDWTLIQDWKSGNQEAAQIMFDRYALRLAAFVTKRIHGRLKPIVSAEDVVQSALGSFFFAAQNSRIQVSQSVSLWKMLATFSKRKLIRSIERQMAVKRGGQYERFSLEHLDLLSIGVDDDTLSRRADEMLESLWARIPDELGSTFELLAAGASVREIADTNKVSERTVSRQISRIRDILLSQPESADSLSQTDWPNSQSSSNKGSNSSSEFSFHSSVLPQWHYREFVLGKMIGAGGFGKVYRATTQKDSPTNVAVKFLRKSFWAKPELKRMLLTEIEQAAKIDHDHVVKYLGWGQSPHGGPFLVMQWIADSQPLSQQRPAIAPNNFLKHLRNICDTMSHVHESGIVHGDLTPNNILLDSRGSHWISDFGFSRQTPTKSEAVDHVKQGFADRAFEEIPLRGGTLGFAAPEQIDNAWGRIGPWTDIYAIGGLAYWYLTGRAPHQCETVAETLSSTIRSDHQSLSGTSSNSKDIRKLAHVAGMALKQPIARRANSIRDLQQKLF